MSFSTTADRIAAFETVHFDYTRQRLNCVRDGDSPRLEHRNFGGIRAFRMTRTPQWTYANTAHGYDVRAFGFAVQWYRDYNISPRFEIPVSHLDFADRAALVKSGLHYVRTHCAMGCALASLGPPPVPNGLKVQVVDAESIEAFIETLLDAYAIQDGREEAKRNMARWVELPEQKLVLALLKNVPVGVGVLYHEGDFGYLATAATLPSYRGRGVHTALIGFRAGLARDLGAKVLFGGAEFGTTAMRNFQNGGLSLLYPRLIWAAAEATSTPAAAQTSD